MTLEQLIVSAVHHHLVILCQLQSLVWMECLFNNIYQGQAIVDLNFPK